MNSSRIATRLFGTTVLASVFGAALAGQALAQSAPPAPAASPDALEEVVVTGTRIQRPNLEANNPVSVVDARSIELSGLTDVADILQRQPQVGIGNNTSTTTNSIRNQGIETLSLRNLGTNRTLTLVDGHRQVGGGVGSSAVDVNTINPTLIERVDIVTGGSSAIYGADAIAGVVNFILKRDFEGVGYKVQYGDSYHGGGGTSFASVTLGHNFDAGRGNVTLSAMAGKQEPIFRYQRNYAISGLAGIPNPDRSTTTSIANVPAFIAQTGVRTNIYGSSVPTGDVRFYSPAVLSAFGTANPAYTYTFTANGSAAIPFDRGTILKSNTGAAQTTSVNCPGCLQSYLDALATGVERQGVESTLRYDLIKDRGWIRDFEIYAEGKYYHNTGWSQSNTGTFAGSSIAYDAAPRADAGYPSSGAAYPIKFDNAYIPANLAAVIAANPTGGSALTAAQTGIGAVGTKVFYLTRIDNDLGDRVYKTRYQSFETVAGFRGTLKNDWKFDSFLNYGETNSDVYQYDRYIAKFFQQIDAVKNPANGQIVCRSTLTNPGNGCIPLNIFSQTHSAAEIAYSYHFDHEVDKVTMLNYQANLSGDLLHYKTLFSGVNVPISFAVGFEFRRESSFQNPDPCNQDGSCWSNFAPITKGSYNTKEGYGELNVPLLADLPFVKRFEVDISGRIQDFTSTGVDGSYGMSANWTINDDFKLRGVYSKAVRAPNINELYANGSVSYATITDPCDSTQVGLGTQPANRRANCIALLSGLGVNPTASGAYAFTQSAATKPTATVGNPDLAPERAQTYTTGFVYTPRWLKGFAFTFDYYDIKIKGAIASLSISSIVNNCVDSPTLANTFCSAVTRGVDGNVTFATSRVFNVASFITKGEDVGVSYRTAFSSFTPWDIGYLTLNFTANHTGDLLYNPVAGDQTTRQQGAGALQYSNPRIKADTRITWDYGPWTATFGTEYISPMNLNNQDKLLDYGYERIPEWFRHDVRVSYTWRGQTFYAGVDNVTDADPPYVPGVFTGTGSASIYGPIGRYIYVGVSGKF